MTEGESSAWLYWLNSKFRRGEVLVLEHDLFGFSAGIRLYSLDIRHCVSWPTADFCVFGTDPRIPFSKYTSIFEMTRPGWKYYGDMQAFVENNRWMKSYAGCASREELMIRISVNGDDPDRLLPYES